MKPLPGQEDQWTLEITLDKTTERPLYASDGQWFFQVTPYVPGMSVPTWDFFQGLSNGTSGSVVGGHGYSMGFDGRHVPMVVAALRSRGEAVTDREIQTFTAFGYVGNEFPTRVRYYLAGKGFDAGRRQAFVLYTHYEKRWGKDLSWTAIFPADLDQ